ncbi:uncharacterized protein L3040_001441 [Drepanopeziza brunnea f. sp. 'multigermtubi']|uniref:Uncharacterized protein n=1 Tax=Marssonina brunnea f. sp. multigermtubi (strain MB_m1) TaxID=1072389 RepID=K1WGN3_MARBU|nr:uncharacterized protein MBM_05169 [Drepanopeziza brunnea f. sp. 'multigermtubi' MB_m1]EKD16700.1 hypothetical protein MBM_05169 [Drepanopeziza brunnea f. sp. 'multigermtubi' MB_m1]KAJ5051666.1 hypothetical protein L3040_001441 [Drepanopeziza brunnea f. sp. 'multigermtubi']
MPAMETVTVINKSGKVISTGKHLVNIFKDAREAYQYKKAELRADHQANIEWKNEQRLLETRQESRSTTSTSRHSRRHRDPASPSRPPVTEHNLRNISEVSGSSTRRSRSHHGSRRATSPHARTSPRSIHSGSEHPGLQRRHSAVPSDSGSIYCPPPLSSQLSRMPPRAHSNPDFHSDSDGIDMNLAYGKLPPDLLPGYEDERQKEELKATMTKLDGMLMEAHCVQHSATAIITNLQANPEAMAAVALTLAELSSLLKTVSPGIITALRSSSPAVFALLSSPQFLIATGVALGVTVVMLGGYKIVKQIQANGETARGAPRLEEPMAYEGTEVGSIETWRRGIADVEVESVATSVDGEFITPGAARQQRERIRERKREERSHGKSRRAPSVVESVRSERTLRRVGSLNTASHQPPSLKPSGSRPPPSESGRSSRSRKTIKAKEKDDESSLHSVLGGKDKKKNLLADMFKRSKEKKEIRQSVVAHRPRIVEV